MGLHEETGSLKCVKLFERETTTLMIEGGVLSMRVTPAKLSGWGQADGLQINSTTTDVSAFLYGGVSVGRECSAKYIGELIERPWWPTSCFYICGLTWLNRVPAAWSRMTFNFAVNQNRLRVSICVFKQVSSPFFVSTHTYTINRRVRKITYDSLCKGARHSVVKCVLEIGGERCMGLEE